MKLIQITTLFAATLYASSALAADGNQVNLVQDGSGLNASIVQTSSAANDSGKNVVNSHQGGSDHQLFVTQVGGGNVTNTSQNGIGNYIDSNVSGHDNLVEIAQGVPGGDDVEDAVASAKIDGDRNEIRVDQRGQKLTSFNAIEGSDNSLTVNQDGTRRNPSAHRLHSDVMISGDQNAVNVNQVHTNHASGWVNGNENQLNITQRNTADHNWFNRAHAEIRGNSNAVNITQIATMVTAGVDITGNGNQASIVQSDGAKGRSNTTQVNLTIKGDDNLSYITQGGVRSLVDVTLNGSNNVSTVRQDGDDNISGIAVNGDGNENWIDVIGDENTAFLTQNGNDHTSGITQRGNENIAEIVQSNGGNQAFVAQNGNYANTNINQTGGSANFASVVQNQ